MVASERKSNIRERELGVSFLYVSTEVLVLISAKVLHMVLKGWFHAFIPYYWLAVQMIAQILLPLQMSRVQIPWGLLQHVVV